MSHIIFFDPEEIKRNGCRFIEFLSDFFHEIHEWTRTGIHFLDRNCDFLSACSFPGEHAVADGFHFTEVEPDFNRNADDCGIAVFKRILDLECAAHIIAELIGPPDKTVRHLAYLCIFLFCQLDFLCIVLEYSEHSGFIVLSSELYDTALCHEPQPCIFIFEGGDFLLYLLPFLLRETPFLGGFALTFGFFGFSFSFCFRRLRKSTFLFRDFVRITLMGGIACRSKA